MSGTLYVLKISDWRLIPPGKKIKILGVRFASFSDEEWIQLSHTGPNPHLLQEAKRLEASGNWNEHTFHSFYLPNYLQSIKSPLSRSEFLQMKNWLDSDIDLYYACYCKEEHLCHRSIVKQIFKQKGYPVNTIKKEP
ncbi:hypothetical protein CN918_25280 [Priestia megaterium]|nr:hypothetical protein CN918_25280 [Priestia megaterium]